VERVDFGSLVALYIDLRQASQLKGLGSWGRDFGRHLKDLEGFHAAMASARVEDPGLGLAEKSWREPADRQGSAKGSVKWGPISKEQEDEVEWVRAQLSRPGSLSHSEESVGVWTLTRNGGYYKGSTKVAVDIDDAEMQKRLRESRAKKAENGAGKRPRDDDEGRVADVLGKRKALEEAH
ncbi:hypothetical protein Prudu_008674, partial [Prunus dulcis]